MIEKLKQLLTPDVDLSVKLATVAALLGRKAVEHDGRITSLEARQLQKGDKGDRGEKGERGEQGIPGKDGVAGPAGRDGAIGPTGKDGKNGKAGKDGVSIVGAEIDFDGHLVLKLSNGNSIDAGKIEVEQKVIYQTSVINEGITPTDGVIYDSASYGYEAGITYSGSLM